MGPVEVYRKTKKPRDLFWNSYVCRPVAAVLVSWIQGTRVTPNQVTLAALLVAAGAGALLITWHGRMGLIAAVVLFEFSYVLDCADGMLARWRGVQSTPGHLLDFLMDEIKAFMILTAVTVRLFVERGDARFLLLGLTGLMCLASGIALTTFQRRPEIAGSFAEGDGISGANHRGGLRSVVRFVEGVAKFFIHYPSYILYAAIAGKIEFYFFPYIGVNVLYFLRALSSVAWRFGRL
ncbi:MAG TPA: CDP-alcohol phosphatidyltransferase family protein [Polyangiaceae bacterium]|jgi:phosphatidylglycerophosphate synthase